MDEIDSVNSADFALSILVCTHNRSDLAARLLAVLIPQMEQHPVELIVVDSASEEAHRVALAITLEQYPDASLRLVQMEEKGLSLARNAGLDIAQAPWVGCIDDDEVPSPDWVVEALALIGRLPEDCGACGGVVRPDFQSHADGNPTSEIGQRWRNFLGEITMDGEFDQTEHPKFGAGHSLLRLSAVRQAGCFNRALGRDGKSLLSGEEVLLLIQLKSLGWRIWHSSRIWVLHDIEPDRLERRWARDRSYWEGVSSARIRRISGEKHPLLPAFAAALKTIPLIAMAPFAPARLEADMRIAFNKGLVFETFRGLLKG